MGWQKVGNIRGPAGTTGFVSASAPPASVARVGDIWVKKPPTTVPQPTFVWDGAAWLPIYGEAGAPSSYEHQQAGATAHWIISHLLHFEPQVKVVNTAGNTVHGAVAYTDNDNLTIDFSEPVAGVAYLS